MTDVRPLKPLAEQLPPPTKEMISRGPLRVQDPANRGDIDFCCPQCGRTLVEGMAEHYIAVAGPVYCQPCQLWSSPSGKPFELEG